LNICFIKRGIYPGFEIIECVQIAELLVKMGMAVSVIAQGDRGEALDETVNGVKILRVPGMNRFSRLVFPFKVLKYLKKQHYDIAHVFWGKGFFLLPLLGPKNIKWICDVCHGNIYGGLRSYLVNVITRFESMYFSKVITNSEHTREKIFSKNDKREMGYIQRGVDTSVFKKINSSDLRKKLNLHEDDKVGIYHGSFHYKRKLTVLIEAVGIASEKIRNIKFIMVGGGGEEKKLRELTTVKGIQDKIIFTGTVSIEKIPVYINIADFAVSFIPIEPVYDAQIPTKLLEYIASNIPVIATATTANRGIVKDGINGLLVKDNAESLVEAIIKLYEKGFELKGASEYNSKITEKYDWTKLVANNLLPLYESLLVGKN